MKHSQSLKPSKSLEYVRVCLFFPGCALAIAGIIVAPKEILSEPQLYSTTVSMAETNEDNFILFDYKVYGTQERLNRGLEAELPSYIAKFKANDDVLVVKLPAESFSAETFAEYVLVHSPNVPELNIEYCVAKNVNAFGSSLPTRSFIKVARDLLGKAKVLYLCAISLIAFLLFLPCGIFGTKALLRLIQSYRNTPQNKVPE